MIERAIDRSIDRSNNEQSKGELNGDRYAQTSVGRLFNARLSRAHSMRRNREPSVLGQEGSTVRSPTFFFEAFRSLGIIWQFLFGFDEEKLEATPEHTTFVLGEI